MTPCHSVVAARPHDIHALSAIEGAAARLLVGHAPQCVLDERTAVGELYEAQAAGRLWVALVDDVPVGFALVVLLGNGSPHLEEIDVDPRYGQRGLGTALVEAVCAWARRCGHPEVTLTTFRDLPWNMPFYHRLGFREIAGEELGRELAAVVRDETARGLDPYRRIAMRYRLEAGRPGPLLRGPAD